MVGIGIDQISITRRLPIEGSTLGHVLARLRAETCGTTLRWSLGDRGSCEFDLRFDRQVLDGNGAVLGYESTAALWDPAGCSPATISVRLVGCEDDESQLEFHPAEDIGVWWTAHLAGYLDLAHAALEELAQELLFQAARVRDELAG
jgi:hypothetical protein